MEEVMKGSFVLMDPKYFEVRDSKAKCIFLASTRPAFILKKGVDLPNARYIDLISQHNGEIVEDGQVTYIDKPSNLTNVGIEVHALLEEKCAFIVIDSVNSMELYNERRVLARFLHNILTRCRMKEVGGIILMVDTDKSFFAEISQLCDKTL